jgi:hypothetical protein
VCYPGFDNGAGVTGDLGFVGFGVQACVVPLCDDDGGDLRDDRVLFAVLEGSVGGTYGFDFCRRRAEFCLDSGMESQ